MDVLLTKSYIEHEGIDIAYINNGVIRLLRILFINVIVFLSDTHLPVYRQS